MKISQNWLEDYVDLSGVSTAELENWITTRVAEVDGVEIIMQPMEYALVALITRISPIENSKKLTNVSIDIGIGRDIQVVCGAPNCKEGLYTAYIPPYGKVLAGEKLVEVTEREVAGVLSCGILASEAELGLTNDHSGIIDLGAIHGGRNPEDIPAYGHLTIGRKIKDIWGGADTVFEIDNKSLTHRPDLWCHYGFAKEIAAILHRPLRKIIDKYLDDSSDGQEVLASIAGSGESQYRVEIDPNTPCSRFMAVEIVQAKNEISPLWMRRRLYAIGAGVRTILVDLSNYVMHDVGQPNHAYDADRVEGKTLTARMAQDGEIFPGLDGESRILSARDMVIADKSGVVALAGVMGGDRSSIFDTTDHLFLESACFDPVTVRLTTKRHAMRTDASNRFEKSRSPYAAAVGILRFVEILLKLQPQVSVVGKVCDAFAQRPLPTFIRVSRNYIRSRLGAPITNEQIDEILTGLSFKLIPDTTDQDVVSVEVPCQRATKDIGIADDLVEEVGRIYGYENIPESVPLIKPVPSDHVKIKDFEYVVRDTLVARGFSEVYNYSFMNGVHAASLGYPLENSIQLQNAVDETEAHLRTSLIPNMVRVVNENCKHQSELYIFEVGRSYSLQFDPRHEKLYFRKQHQTNPTTFERRLACLAYSSGKPEKQVSGQLKPVLEQGGDFYSLAATIRSLVWISTTKPLILEPISTDCGNYLKWMHPYRSAKLIANGVELGFIAEAKPGIFEDVDRRVVFAELDLELLMEIDDSPKVTKALPKFPDSFFELAVVLSKDEPYRNLEKLFLDNADTPFLRDIEPLSVYTGKPLAEHEKSVAVKFRFGSDERTLAREEVDGLQNKFMEIIKNSQYALR